MRGLILVLLLAGSPALAADPRPSAPAQQGRFQVAQPYTSGDFTVLFDTQTGQSWRLVNRLTDPARSADPAARYWFWSPIPVENR